MNCIDIDCCVPQAQMNDAKTYLKRLFKHLWSHEKTYVLLKVDTLEFEVLEYKPTREQMRQMVSRTLATASIKDDDKHMLIVDDEALCGTGTVYCNLLAMMLYGTGHPVCGNVLIVPRS